MTADTVFLNGNVVTIDQRQPRANAVAILNGRIIAVGDTDDIRTEIGANTHVVDLEGRTVLPGLNDNHLHPIQYGFNLAGVDVSPRAVATLDGLLGKFATAAQATPRGQWIRGHGYDDTRLDTNSHPTRWDLDRVTADHPAILTRTCHHISVANSRALELAGISTETPDPTGGQIDRDEDGVPNGVLRELAQGLVRREMPTQTVDDMKNALLTAGEKLLSMGITSIGEAGCRKPEDLHVYQDLRRQNALPLRVFLMMVVDTTSETGEVLGAIERLGLQTGLGDEWLRIGPAKFHQDGSGGGRTAAMSTPYPDEPENYGIAIYTQEELDAGFRRIAAAGLQATAHAIGDRAVDMILTAYERALAAYPQNDHRWRIEHCGLLTPTILERLGKLGIVPVPQPSFIHYLGDSYIRNFSPETLALSYPGRAWLDRGLHPVGSSDAPVTPAHPWTNIRAAVTRLTQDGQTMGPDQGVTVDEALRMFTINGAYATFEEQVKGTITPGKVADLIVIDRDPYTIDPTELHTIQTDLTMINGRIVYQR